MERRKQERNKTARGEDLTHSKQINPWEYRNLRVTAKIQVTLNMKGESQKA